MTRDDVFLEEDLADIVHTRVEARCIKNEKGCWVFQGGLDKHGYGRINIRRRKKDFDKHFYTHRLTYAFYRGDIPHNKELHHDCENRNCCNPAHLILDTRKGNMAKRWAKASRGIKVEKF